MGNGGGGEVADGGTYLSQRKARINRKKWVNILYSIKWG